MKSKPVFGLVLLLGLAFADVALACSCDPPPAAAAMEMSAAVFLGKVVKVDGGGITLQVERSWKGADCGEVTVRTGGPCGADFEMGKSYLVYARQDDGFLSAQPCTRTRDAEQGQEDFKALGEPKSCG